MSDELPDDLLIDPMSETVIRRDLVQVALARRPADCLLRVGRLFDAATGSWLEDAEVVIRGRRIAYTGPVGSWRGNARTVLERPGFRLFQVSERFTSISKALT